jgi:hypothetical protein
VSVHTPGLAVYAHVEICLKGKIDNDYEMDHNTYPSTNSHIDALQGCKKKDFVLVGEETD